jgi:hypothetical protein
MKLVLVAMLVVASACTTAADTATTPTVGETTTATESPSTDPVEPTPPPDTEGTEQAWTIEDHLAWFLTLLNGADVAAETYEARFAQVFRDQVPFPDFTLLIDQITAGTTGWSVVDTETSGATNLVVLIAPAGGEPVLRFLLNIDADQRLDGLFLQPSEPPVLDDPPESYDEAFDQLAALGTAGVAVAETTGGSCSPVAETLSGMPLPLGSMFKLYVLGAVADAVASGDITWEDPVTLDESNYSLPGGITQNAEPGSTLTVSELAQRMIEISDNTATDHLIALVGRQAVEAVQAGMGHSDPSLNMPFLTTRELFQLKVGDSSALDSYGGADAEARRQILDDLASEPLPDLSAAVGFTEPTAVLSAEWFASPLDLCEAWRHLSGRAAEPGLEPLVEIATANPGVPDETGTWDQIWFKGGSEPSVLGMSWYLTTGDGRSFVVAGSVVNEADAFDETEAVLLFGAIRDLLAEQVSG